MGILFIGLIVFAVAAGVIVKWLDNTMYEVDNGEE